MIATGMATFIVVGHFCDDDGYFCDGVLPVVKKIDYVTALCRSYILQLCKYMNIILAHTHTHGSTLAHIYYIYER